MNIGAGVRLNHNQGGNRWESLPTPAPPFDQTALLGILRERILAAGGRQELAERLGVQRGRIDTAMAYGKVGQVLAQALGYQTGFVPAPMPEPEPVANLDPRYLAGCALVQRYGTPGEVAAMFGNRAEVEQINALTRAWLAERNREAA